MSLLNELVAEMSAGATNRLFLPEHRQIELYTKRKSLDFAPPESPTGVPCQLLAGAIRAYMALECFLAPLGGGEEAPNSWTFYKGLPRVATADKLVAEIYRILRIARLVLPHPHGRVDVEDGVVKINGFVGRVALSLEITPVGLRLIESAVSYWLQSQSQPYPAAYVEAVLAEYYFDIVAEIRRFCDENRALFQFRRTRPFCRHFRFDCDNPKVKVVDDEIEIEIGPLHRDKARYPIDFFVILEGLLHIIPVEALSEGRIARSELAKWRANVADGVRLPAAFRARFGRDVVVAGQPMT